MSNTPSFLRWVGSKARLIPTLLEYLPETPVNYFEPFAGGASLYFVYGHRATEGRYLNDICFPLAVAYQAMAECPDFLFENLVNRVNEYQNYDVLRSQFNAFKAMPVEELSLEDRLIFASLFICINHLCFNGVYRENKKGEFNVPLGTDSKKNPRTLDNIDWGKLDECAVKLRGAVVTSDSFTPWPFTSQLVRCENRRIPGPGDVVFYDSPYLKEFSGYNKEGFTSDHHLLLCAQATAIARKGATVIVCGSNNDASREIYGEPTRVVSLQRTVGNFKNSDKKRGKAEEALWVWNGKTTV